MTSQPCSSAVLLTEPNSQSATQSNIHVTIQQQSHCVTVTKSHSQRVTKPHMYQIITLRGDPLEFLFFVTSSFRPSMPALLILHFKYFSQVRRRRTNLRMAGSLKKMGKCRIQTHDFQFKSRSCALLRHHLGQGSLVRTFSYQVSINRAKGKWSDEATSW